MTFQVICRHFDIAHLQEKRQFSTSRLKSQYLDNKEPVTVVFDQSSILLVKAAIPTGRGLLLGYVEYSYVVL